MSKRILSVALVSLISLPVFATEAIETTPSTASEPEAAAALPVSEPTDSNSRGFYTGLRIGNYSTSVNNLSFSAPAGLVIGYGRTTLGIEMEINSADVELDFPNNSMTYTAAGLYASFRTQSKAFVKFRAGLVQQSISAELSSDADINVSSDLGFSASAGGGLRLTNQALLDFDVTLIDQDLTAVSLGLNLFF